MKWAVIAKVLKFYLRFTLSFTRIGYYGRRLFFDKSTASFAGKTVLVTGASGGIGRAAAMQFNGANVIAAARNAEKLDALCQTDGCDLASIVPAVHDLSLQSGTMALVQQCAALDQKIDILINNVGVLLNKPSVTDEGFDTSFATNILNHYILTQQLIKHDLLAKDAIIINVSSGGMYNAPLIPAALNNKSKSYNGDMAYALHKRAQVALTHFWRDHSDGRAFYVMHPGWVDTQGVKDSLPNFRKLLKSILRNGDMGADTIIWLANMRPDQKGEAIWFDRKARKTHISQDMLDNSADVRDLIAYLESHILDIDPDGF